MYFNSSSWYDGAVGVSQWYARLKDDDTEALRCIFSGIPPGQTFNYVIDAAASQSQTGTYWYHSHFGLVRMTQQSIFAR